MDNGETKTAVKNLERYLEMETLLNGFFESFGYCYNQCIRVEIEKNDGKPIAACCKNRYHCLYDLDDPAFGLLRIEREKRYGKPEDQENPAPVSPCEYHGPSGCRLSTHKSPICLAFMCRESIDVLREKYGIFGYDYLGVNYALEWILTGIFSDKDYTDFSEGIVAMTEKIRQRNIFCR
jgi:hypothetical protein